VVFLAGALCTGGKAYAVQDAFAAQNVMRKKIEIPRPPVSAAQGQEAAPGGMFSAPPAPAVMTPAEVAPVVPPAAPAPAPLTAPPEITSVAPAPVPEPSAASPAASTPVVSAPAATPVPGPLAGGGEFKALPGGSKSIFKKKIQVPGKIPGQAPPPVAAPSAAAPAPVATAPAPVAAAPAGTAPGEAPKPPETVAKAPPPTQEGVAGHSLEGEEGEAPKLTGAPKYLATNKTNPFMPLIDLGPTKTTEPRPIPVETKGPKIQRIRPKSPLEKFDLGQLHVVGIMRTQYSRIALIQDPSGRGYRVTKGMYIGVLSGRVVQIDDDKIIVEESVADLFGKVSTKRTELKLYEVVEG
jgi:Tfp pilus assembly protein PilP